jgi:ATP-binding cassette, subfamily B, bacterial PglK
MIILLKRLWRHITARRKKQLSLIMLLILMTSVAEVISIGAVLPFLGVLANPEIVFQHEYAQPLIAYIGIDKPSQLLFPFTIAFAVVSILAGLMRIALLWGQTRLAHAIGSDLSYQIYQRTLYQPYSVHIARNSSEIIAGISTKADQVVSQTLLPVLYIISSLFMFTMILIALIAIHPIMALSTIIGFILIYSIIIFLSRQRLLTNSRKISQNTNLTVKVLQEGLGGVRDVLIDGTQDIYCTAFRAADMSRRASIANNQIIGQSPRYSVESLGIVLISGLAYILVGSEGGLVGVLPLLGALAIGAQRMLPMLQQAYMAWSNIRGSQIILQDTLVLIEQSLPKYAESPNITPIPFKSTITLQQLGFQYRNDAPWVLKEIDLNIHKGSRVGFIGTTGSGKSTLLDIVMALLHPSQGVLKIDGIEIHEGNHRGWQSHIAHIPQSIYLSDATLAENIAFGLPKDKIDYDKIASSAQKAQIAETIESWATQYETMVGERGVRLSGGQRQRIGIARALYKHADVLIFDEATSALDSQTEKAVMSAIDETHKDITILIVAHRLSTLKNCDMIVELENGSIKRKGTPKEMISRSQ